MGGIYLDSHINKCLKLFALCLYAGFISCHYEIEPIEYTGPQFPLTSEGKNILTFNYNDTLWINESNTKDDIQCDLILDTNGIYKVSIYAYSRFEKYYSIFFSFLVDEKFNQIKDDSLTYLVLRRREFDSCNKFNPITNDIIVNLIKLDTIERIVAGELTVPRLINPCGETITITKARFDVTYFKF